MGRAFRLSTMTDTKMYMRLCCNLYGSPLTTVDSRFCPRSSRTPIQPSTRFFERFRPTVFGSSGQRAKVSTGEKAPEALHQLDTVRKFYVAGSPGCARKCHAECVSPKQFGWRTTNSDFGCYQTNTQRDIPEHATMAAISISMRLRSCAKKGHLKHSALSQQSGV
jgi:hypothetical protein